MTFVRFSKLFFGLILFLSTKHLNAAVAPAPAQLENVVFQGMPCSSKSTDCVILKEDAEFMLSEFVKMQIHNKDEDWIRRFVRVNGVEWRDNKGQTFLHYAVLSQDINFVRFVFEELGCPFRVFDVFGNSPLDYSNGEVFEYLMNKFSDLILSGDRSFFNEYELLEIACRHVNSYFIKKLVEPPFNTTVTSDLPELLRVSHYRMRCVIQGDAAWEEAERDYKESREYIIQHQRSQNLWPCNIL